MQIDKTPANKENIINLMTHMLQTLTTQDKHHANTKTLLALTTKKENALQV